MGHFHIFKCEEMIFPVPRGLMILVSNKGISPCNFSINPLKNHQILRKNKLKNRCRNKCAFHQIKIN